MAGGPVHAGSGSDDAARTVDRAFAESFLKLARHVDGGTSARFGAVTAFVTGLPFRLFNGCLVLEPARLADVDAALAWTIAAGVPLRVWAREDLEGDLAPLVAGGRLAPDPPGMPGMLLRPIPEPPRPAPELEIVTVDDRASLEEHRGVLVEGGMGAGTAARMVPSSFAFDPEVRLFTVRLAGRPVGTSIAIRHGEASGVYGVGTLPAARRHGVGTAATWAAVTAGRAWGCEVTTLQATEMGLRIYESMGFRIVVRYSALRPAP